MRPAVAAAAAASAAVAPREPGWFTVTVAATAVAAAAAGRETGCFSFHRNHCQALGYYNKYTYFYVDGKSQH